MSKENEIKNEWKQLWDCSFESFYNALFEEACSEYLMKRWRLFDISSKILVGITASTSAIAGWALWDDPFYRNVWALIAGISALAAIINGSLNISERIKEETLTFSESRHLRLELDRLRKKMSIMAYDSLRTYKSEYLEILDKYAKTSADNRSQIFLSEKSKEHIQKQINKSLGYD